MKLEVETPDHCPLRHVNDEGIGNSTCQLLDIWNGGYCNDDKVFPDCCPLLKGPVTIEKNK